jgi:hypothetical protein
MERMSVFTDLKSEISNLKSLAETISRHLCDGMPHLRDSPFRCQRYLTSRIRQADQAPWPRRIHAGIGRGKKENLERIVRTGQILL